MNIKTEVAYVLSDENNEETWLSPVSVSTVKKFCEQYLQNDIRVDGATLVTNIDRDFSSTVSFDLRDENDEVLYSFNTCSVVDYRNVERAYQHSELAKEWIFLVLNKNEDRTIEGLTYLETVTEFYEEYFDDVIGKRTPEVVDFLEELKGAYNY